MEATGPWNPENIVIFFIYFLSVETVLSAYNCEIKH